MKAVDYLAKYGDKVFDEATKGQHDTMLVMFEEMYAEIETICKTRNAIKDSAKVSAVKEINTKWNKLRDLFTKTYTVSPLKKNAIQKVFLDANPNAAGLFVIEKSTKKFEPDDAQKEWDKMSPTSKFLVSMAMIGAMARGDIDLN